MTQHNRPYRIITLAAFSLLVLAPLSGAAPPPLAQPTPLTQVPGLQQILQVPFHFTSLWTLDRSKGQPVQATAQGNKAVWPLRYDLRPALVNLTWAPHNFPQEKIPDLVAGRYYTLEVVLNGYPLQRGPDATAGQYYAYAVTPGASTLYGCPAGKTCLVTTILATAWYSSWAPPWHVELRLTPPRRAQPQVLGPCPGDPTKLCPQPPPGPGPTPITVKATVERSKPEVSYFAAKIYPTFQHSNCTTCHYLDTPAKLVSQHKGLPVAVTQVPSNNPPGMLLTCGGGCHYVLDQDWKLNQIVQYVPGKKFDDTEWKAPAADMGINWTGKSAKEICKIITTRLPTAQKLKHHFHDDVRLAWSVHSGLLPLGRGEKPLAPPGSYLGWKDITTIWADNGFPCPK